MLYFKIFDRDYVNSVPVTGITRHRDLEYLRRTYNYNKDKIQEYYLTRNFAVKNTHIISRIIEHLPLMPEAGYYDLLPVAEDRFEYLAKSFKFTSGIEKGIVHPPYFYGNGGSDIILTESGFISKRDIVDNWQTYPCVTTFLHPRNDLKLLLPLGKDDGSKGGLSTISIDGTALTVKYNEFIKEQRRKLESGEEGTILNKNHFVSKYVLPGMLESEIDHIFMNKLMDRFYGVEETTPRFKHKFPIFEPTLQVNRFIDDTLDLLNTKKMDYVNSLNNINLIFNVNATQLLSFKGIPNTRQSNWAFVVSRLRHMCFLYDVSADNARNTKMISDWKLLIKRIENDNAILGQFGYERKKEIDGYIEKIKDM